MHSGFKQKGISLTTLCLSLSQIHHFSASDTLGDVCFLFLPFPSVSFYAQTQTAHKNKWKKSRSPPPPLAAVQMQATGGVGRAACQLIWERLRKRGPRRWSGRPASSLPTVDKSLRSVRSLRCSGLISSS